MTGLIYSLMAIVPVAVIIASVAFSMKKFSNGATARRSMKSNLAAFMVAVLLVAGFAMTASAVSADDAAPAQDTAAVETVETEAAAPKADNSKGLGLLAAGLVTGLAGIGGGLAVAAGAPAAIAATSEDPKAFGKALIFVALGESIALYGVVISILILNKV